MRVKRQRTLGTTVTGRPVVPPFRQLLQFARRQPSHTTPAPGQWPQSSSRRSKAGCRRRLTAATQRLLLRGADVAQKGQRQMQIILRDGPVVM